MSALGQERTSPAYFAMSALPLKADKAQTCWHVCFVPEADSCTAANDVQVSTSLFGHRGGAIEQRDRRIEAEGLPRYCSGGSRHCGVPPLFLHSDRNFLRALPCRPLASA